MWSHKELAVDHESSYTGQGCPNLAGISVKVCRFQDINHWRYQSDWPNSARGFVSMGSFCRIFIYSPSLEFLLVAVLLRGSGNTPIFSRSHSL